MGFKVPSVYDATVPVTTSPPTPITTAVLGAACPNVFMARVSAGERAALPMLKMITFE